MLHKTADLRRNYKPKSTWSSLQRTVNEHSPLQNYRFRAWSGEHISKRWKTSSTEAKPMVNPTRSRSTGRMWHRRGGWHWTRSMCSKSRRLDIDDKHTGLEKLSPCKNEGRPERLAGVAQMSWQRRSEQDRGHIQRCKAPAKNEYGYTSHTMPTERSESAYQ